MRIRGIVAVLAVACSGLAMPPAGAAEGDIVLKGSRSGWVDLALPRDVSIHDVTVTTKGRYGGFYAKNVTMTIPQGKPQSTFAAEILLRGFAASGQPARPVSFGLPQLFAGTARFYLLADGPTTVRIKTDAFDRDETLTPARRAATALATGPLALTTDGWLRHARVNAGPKTLTFAALFAEGQALAAAETEVCVTDSGATCPERTLPYPGQSADSEAVVPYTERARIWTVTMLSGKNAPRRRVARFRLSHELQVDRALGGALTLTLA